jgi:non-heme chloroperoxidase
MLIAHGDDDQTVPIAASAERSIKLVKAGTLKVYPGIYGAHQAALDRDILTPIASSTTETGGSCRMAAPRCSDDSS